MENFILDLAKLLEVEREKIVLSEDLANYANWDSLSAVSTIALIDQHFSKVVGWEEIEKCKTMRDLLLLTEAPLGVING